MGLTQWPPSYIITGYQLGFSLCVCLRGIGSSKLEHVVHVVDGCFTHIHAAFSFFFSIPNANEEKVGGGDCAIEEREKEAVRSLERLTYFVSFEFSVVVGDITDSI